MFDIMILRWINLFLIIVAIIYAHAISKKTNNFYLVIPILIWLFQALLFYIVYLSYTYEVIVLSENISNILHSYWATSSRFLGLITMFIYLYYIQHSCWRGNGKL